MDEKRYTIRLEDGTEIKNLRLNGTCYISDEPISKESFVDNCSPLTISDGDTEEVHENVELVQFSQYGSEYWVAFRDLTPDEIANDKMRSDIEYIAMMTDTELE